MTESGQRTVRIAVADDRRLIADALAALLGKVSGFTVTGVITGDGAAAVATHKPDVVLVGTPDHSEGALTLMRQVRAREPNVAIVALADAVEPGLIAFVLDQRLNGLLLTDAPADDLATCIDQVASGHVVLPASWQAVLADDPDDPLSALSGRQREVLELLAEGVSYEQIAARLFISVNTVKFHVRTIFSQLGVHNRMAAARLLSQYAGAVAAARVSVTG